MSIPLFVFIPAMVMGEVAATIFPVTDEILSADVVRIDPVRAFVRRMRPVTVVPLVVRSLRIPISLDPPVVRARAGWDAIGARRRRRADLNAEGNLRLDRRSGDEERCGDSECLKKSSHD